MSIPDAAVEAAAKTMYEQRPHATDPAHWETPWEDVPEAWKRGQEEAARAVLQAALPWLQNGTTDALNKIAEQLRLNNLIILGLQTEPPFLTEQVAGDAATTLTEAHADINGAWSQLRPNISAALGINPPDLTLHKKGDCPFCQAQEEE